MWQGAFHLGWARLRNGDFAGVLASSEKFPQVTEIGQSYKVTGEFGKYPDSF